jgi:MFS family permease
MEPEPEHGASAISFASYARLLRGNRNFRRLWMAQIVSEIGDWFYTLAIYSLLLQLTGHASSVALALVLQVLPQTFMVAPAGVVNDRIRRKHVMIATDLARMVIVLCMMLVRSREAVWLVYLLLLLETVAVSFFEPARNSVIPNITAREDVVLANTVSSATWSVNLVFGATLGGLVAALLGRNAVFVLNALSFLWSATLIRGMKFDEPHARHAEPLRASDLVDFTPVEEGIRYVRRDRKLLATIFVKAGNLVIGPSWVLFTVMGLKTLATQFHGMDAQRAGMLGMSFLLGARGLGALLGPLLSARWAGNRQNRLQLGILCGYLTCAVGYFLLGSVSSLWIACAFIVLAHCGGSTVWVFSTTLLQLNTEDRFRGRVFAADMALCMLTIALGAWAAGAFVDHGTPIPTVVKATGLVMLVPAFLWWMATRMWVRKPELASEQVLK